MAKWSKHNSEIIVNSVAQTALIGSQTVLVTFNYQNLCDTQSSSSAIFVSSFHSTTFENTVLIYWCWKIVIRNFY